MDKSFIIENSKVFLRDKFVDFKDANLSITSSPILYGLSIYTVISAYVNPDTKEINIFRIKDHYKRLINSAKIIDFHEFISDWDYSAFESTIIELIKSNKIHQDVLIRATAFIDENLAGTKIHGLKNSFSAFIYPLTEVLNLNGINVCVSSWQRTADNAIPSRAKLNGSYINASLMKNEAILNGYDDAIAIDSNGHISEGTVANIFIIKDNKLITPDNSTDLLEGITRDSIRIIAKNNKIECIERAVDRSELYTADEIFICGSSVRITPVLSVDRRPIGDGKIGQVTKLLKSIYQDVLTGKLPNYDDWRLKVS